MRRALFIAGLVAASVALASFASPSHPAPAPPLQPLQTAIDDPVTFSSPAAGLAFARTRAAGATFAELTLRWFEIAPNRPPNPTDPADPAYNWNAFDTQVRLAIAHGLQPMVIIEDAPLWAQGTPPAGNVVNNWAVDPVEFGNFALAAARRYSGAFDSLPRVRYWQVWDEPNLNLFLDPQLSSELTKKPGCPFNPDDVVSADRYRSMVNAAADAIHSVQSSDLVIAGGMSPFCGTNGVVATAPLLFMRKLLCMSNDPIPKPTCSQAVRFDIWTVHPYTAGGPTDKALRPDDVSLGDLPEVSKLLKAAVRAGHVVSARPVGFWVTEFGWDTKPPDCCAVPLGLHARWVAEALYRMWLDGVTLATWFLLRDQANNGRPDLLTIQSGLYFRGTTLAQDRPKPSLSAFRFPVVAFRVKKGILVWGRTPWGTPGTVIVEQSSKSGWKQLTRLATNRYGIFSRTLASSGPGTSVRARLVGKSVSSVPFSLIVPPDLVVNPFGGPPGPP